jgi:hypothetical protein
VSCRRRRPELFRKSGLSDTWLSANPDDTRAAALAVVESANQYSELAFAAEQLTRRGLEHSRFGVDQLAPGQQSAHASYIAFQPTVAGPPTRAVREQIVGVGGRLS